MAGVKGRSGGHNRKSEAQHQLDGTFRPDRHGGKVRPTPDVGEPDAPASLSTDARREWVRLVRLLEGSEMLTVVDGAMLFQYCELFGESQAAKRELVALRRSVTKKSSLKERIDVQRQASRITGNLLQYRQQIRMYLAEFGLSPKSRSSIDISPAGAGLAEPIGDNMSEFDTPPALQLVHGRRDG